MSIFEYQIVYMGHVMSDKGVLVDHEKIQSVVSWPILEDENVVRWFLGLVIYTRKYVRDFVNIVALIINLLSKKSKSSLGQVIAMEALRLWKNLR